MSELGKIKELLDKKFNELKEELQSGCEHEEISDWMEVHWAPGHGTGQLVKECNRCGLVMEEASGFVDFEPDASEPSGLKKVVKLTESVSVTVVTDEPE